MSFESISSTKQSGWSLGHYAVRPWVFSCTGFWRNGDWQHGFAAYHDAVDLFFACHCHLTTIVDLGGWGIGYTAGLSSYECRAVLCDGHRCNFLGGSMGLGSGNWSSPCGDRSVIGSGPWPEKGGALQNKLGL